MRHILAVATIACAAQLVMPAPVVAACHTEVYPVNPSTSPTFPYIVVPPGRHTLVNEGPSGIGQTMHLEFWSHFMTTSPTSPSGSQSMAMYQFVPTDVPGELELLVVGIALNTGDDQNVFKNFSLGITVEPGERFVVSAVNNSLEPQLMFLAVTIRECDAPPTLDVSSQSSSTIAVLD